MAPDIVLQKEPLVEFLIERGLSNTNAVMKFSAQRPAEDDEDPLNGFIRTIYETIPEGAYLSWLLTHRPFICTSHFTGAATEEVNTCIVSEAYLPAPGRSDGVCLAPDPGTLEAAQMPQSFARTRAWLVSHPLPSLVILTYDPATLADLRQSTNYWLDRALLRRRDVGAAISLSANQHFGITSPHQFFGSAERWFQMPCDAAYRDICESHRFDPFFATELAFYCWDDGERGRTLQDFQDMANLTDRRIIARPRIYGSNIPKKMARPSAPEVNLIKHGEKFWRQYFVSLVDESAIAGDSDIHLLPKKDGGYIIKRRRDGHLHTVGSIPSDAVFDYLGASLAGSRIELSTQRAIPKDGRVTIALPKLGRPIDMRISVLPGLAPFERPGIVFRLLDSETVRGGLNQILITDYDRQAWEIALGLQRGIILVTGPTGSGKSRTLYAFLQTLHQRHPDRSYKSNEDPVELYVGDWLQQNSVDTDAGSSMELVQRGLMRADPEVIFTGEIRDAASARDAIMGARSGHLCIASLHADSPAQVPHRLKEFGILPGDIASLIRFVTAQTLLGRSCPNCRSIVPLTPDLRRRFRVTTPTAEVVTTNCGCTMCNRGIRGRFAAQEYLICQPDDHEMQKAFAGSEPSVIERLQRDRGHMSLSERTLMFAVGTNAMTNLSELAD